MKVTKKAVLPLGFQANGLHCGIKRSGKLDLALFYSDVPAKASCLFTSNKIQAAPLKVNKKYLKSAEKFQAIIVNSGNANCFTGAQGLIDAQSTSEILAKYLGLKKESVLVNSTGIIGKRLPLLKIKKAIPALVWDLSDQGIAKAKKAIMTTDTKTKEITVKFNLGKIPVVICGIAKGAGMIAPNMATMLSFIFTDANITQGALNKALKVATESSFNSITVDGCMSTNDSVMLLANGVAGNKEISQGKDFNVFLNALKFICLELAKMIIRDAEGATKFINITVNKARNVSEAKAAALAIANSNLFKTAIFGENPNFGRIVSAVGASGIEVSEDTIKMKISPLNKKEIAVCVEINKGNSRATVYTSDLTPEYIKINASYN